MSPTRLPFLDTMKALGLALIVWGHVAAGSVEMLTPPIRTKQLGVAFFLFATGFSLARETRGSLRVLFNRLFEVFLFGLICAIITSIAAFWRLPADLPCRGRLELSNYL